MTKATDNAMIKSWLAKVERAAKKLDAKAIAAMFGKECHWCDLVALTWNIQTVKSRYGIEQMLLATLPQIELLKIRMDGAAEWLKRLGVEAIIVEKNPRPGASCRNRYRSMDHREFQIGVT